MVRCDVRIKSLKQKDNVILDFETGFRTQRTYRLFKNAINSQKTLKKYDGVSLRLIHIILNKLVTVLQFTENISHSMI